MLKLRDNIDNKTLRRIRRGNLEARIKESVIVMEERGIIFSVTFASELISDGNFDATQPVIRRFLVYQYGNAVLGVRERFGFKIPAIQPLREELGLYRGNLYEAKRAYSGSLRTNYFDFLRNVRVPLSIDATVAELLGVLWADGCFTGNRHHYAIQLQGRRKDIELYGAYVKDLIKKVFNLDSAPVIFRSTVKRDGKKIIYHRPMLNIHSGAIVSWLMNVAGFPRSNSHKDLPKFELNPELTAAFFRGLFRTMSRTATNGDIAITDISYNFITELYKISKELFEVNPHITQNSGKQSYSLFYRARDIEKLKRFGAITDGILENM